MTDAINSLPMLRSAILDDLDELARLHVDIWRDTYRDLAPTSAYEALDLPARTEHWADLLGRGPSSTTIVAEEPAEHGHAGRLVAFGHAGPATHELVGNGGELVHLFVHRDFQRSGLGYQLFQELMLFLCTAGHSKVVLDVVEGNDHAVRFYERAGGALTGSHVTGQLWRSKNLTFTWNCASGPAHVN